MSSKPRILVISQVYVPDPAAVGQYLADASAALVERGYDVRVLTSARGYADPTAVYPARETIDGVEVIRLPLSSLGKRTILLRLVGQALFLLQVLVRGMFTPRLSAILVSTSPPFASTVAVIIRFFRRVPIKYWLMDLNPDQMIELGKITETSLPARLFNFLNRRIWKAADDIVALDRFMVERVVRKLDVRDKITVLPPWPHGEHTQSLSHDENSFRKEHHLDGKFVLMYGGNHGFSTPIDTIVDAALRLQHRDDVVFMFIGEGVGKRVVERAIEEHGAKNIVSLPYQPLETIRYSLSAADVHLVSVGNDVVGVVHPCKVYGAMALARPILLLGPVPCHVSDIVADHNVGWQLSHGEVDRAVELIQQIADMPASEREAMGQAAADVIHEHFDRDTMVEQFTQVVTRGIPDAQLVKSSSPAKSDQVPA